MNSALRRVAVAAVAVSSWAAHETVAAAQVAEPEIAPSTDSAPSTAPAIAATPAPSPPTVVLHQTQLPVEFSSRSAAPAAPALSAIQKSVASATATAAATAPAPVAAAPIASPAVSPSSAIPANARAQLPLPPATAQPIAQPVQPSDDPQPLPAVVVSPTPLPAAPALPSYGGTPPAPSAVASQLGFNYRVIVPASNDAMQQRVRSIVPGSFRTTVNGQTAMQVGLFRDASSAEAMKRSLDSQNLQATILRINPAPPAPSTPPVSPPPSTPAPPPSSAANLLYRVVVPASTTAMQQRVQSAVPGSFRTTVNGQTAMQVGLFRDQSTAEEMQRSLGRQSLQASVIPVTQVAAQPPAAGNLLYRVIVPASTTATQQRVQSAVPGSFRTVLNGQTVMQVGLFRELSTAENLQRSLLQQNLQASVLSVSESAVRPPQTPLPRPSTPGTNPTQNPQERIVVMIDPGHGGRDPGAVGIGGLRETDINLSISQQVASFLEQAGIQARMTRSDGRGLELSTRVQLAERANADLFVSIHSNAISMSRPDVNGVETYYYNSGRSLAQSIHSSIMREVDMNDRGVRQARFYVLRNTSMPSVLVEVGFVTGRSDAAKLSNPTFRTKMAQAIANGIIQHVRSR